MLEAPSSDPVDLCKQLVGQGGPRLVCVTRAAQGCLLVTADDEHVAPGVEVEVADAVGAGDAFTAALIASQLRRWPLAASAWFVVTRPVSPWKDAVGAAPTYMMLRSTLTPQV